MTARRPNLPIRSLDTEQGARMQHAGGPSSRARLHDCDLDLGLPYALKCRSTSSSPTPIPGPGEKRGGARVEGRSQRSTTEVATPCDRVVRCGPGGPSDLAGRRRTEARDGDRHGPRARRQDGRGVSGYEKDPQLTWERRPHRNESAARTGGAAVVHVVVCSCATEAMQPARQ
jgi:hypothetical protein